MQHNSAALIRAAAPADATALATLERIIFSGERISLPSFRRLLAAETAALSVAETGGKPIGYALVLFRKNAGCGRLYSIGVAPEAAGAGIGASLLEHAETNTLARGLTRLRLEVSCNNPRAIALYERAGYRSFAIRPKYYSDGSDALRMEKILRAEPSVQQHQHRSA